jgi:hypothetical protein
VTLSSHQYRSKLPAHSFQPLCFATHPDPFVAHSCPFIHLVSPSPSSLLSLTFFETLQARYRQRAAEKEKYSIAIYREVEKKADNHKL